jgi:hypothetical protein
MRCWLGIMLGSLCQTLSRWDNEPEEVKERIPAVYPFLICLRNRFYALSVLAPPIVKSRKPAECNLTAAWTSRSSGPRTEASR